MKTLVLDPDEQLSPEGLVKWDVGQICTPSLLSYTAVKISEGLHFIHTQDHIELLPISGSYQAHPTPIWMVLVIDIANNSEVVEDYRDVFIILLHDTNGSIIVVPDEILLLRHNFLEVKTFDQFVYIPQL